MSIFKRYFLAIFLLLTVSTAITATFSAHEQNAVIDKVHLESTKVLEANHLKLFQQRGFDLATLLEKTLVSPLAQGDSPHVADTARLVLKQPMVCALVVFDKQKEVLFNSDNSALSVSDSSSQLLSPGNSHGEPLVHWQGENSIHFLKNIYLDDNFLGGFYLELSLADFSQSLKSIQNHLLQIKEERNDSSHGKIVVIVFFLLVLGLWLAYRVTHYITRPIHSLAQTVHSIREGNYDIDIPFHGSDEIGQLSLELQGLTKELKNTMVSRDYLETVFSSMQDPLVVVNRQGKIQTVNRPFACLAGTSEESLAGEKIWDFLEIEEEGQKQCLGQGQAVTGMACRLRVGSQQELLVSVVKMPRAGKKEGNYVFVIRDISKQKWLAEMVRYNANRDSLTGLASRNFFLREFENAVQSRREVKEASIALLFIDLDRFKHINDSFGHPFGDAVLRACSERIQRMVRNGDAVSRLGGDEFVVLLKKLESETEAWRIAQRLHQELTQPFNIEGREIFLGCSIGITCNWQDFEDPSQILVNADLAMHEAKKKSSEKVVFYTEGMRSQTEALLFLETDLRTAINNKAIDIHFQPIMTISDDALRGFEVLARWDHPQRGMIQPSLFIPLAERVGLIESLEWIIFEKSFAQRQEWRKKFPDIPFYLAVNVSGYQLGQISLPVHIGRSFLKYGICPGEIVFEVTETMLMNNPAVAGRVLSELKRSGARLALDDFGTGYSSLSYLSRFPFDFLKVDQSFVRGASEKPEGHHGKIVEVISRLGHSLGMDVVAEGVETAEDLQKVTDFGIDAWQGFLCSRPLDAEGAELILKESRLPKEKRYFSLSS